MSEQKVTRDWGAEFNALPYDTRVIGGALNTQTRIQQLTFEKKRLTKRYQKSCREIDEHIRSCERWLKELEAPNE